jgi:hypothetical protein
MDVPVSVDKVYSPLPTNIETADLGTFVKPIRILPTLIVANSVPL